MSIEDIIGEFFAKHDGLFTRVAQMGKDGKVGLAATGDIAKLDAASLKTLRDFEDAYKEFRAVLRTSKISMADQLTAYNDLLYRMGPEWAPDSKNAADIVTALKNARNAPVPAPTPAAAATQQAARPAAQAPAPAAAPAPALAAHPSGPKITVRAPDDVDRFAADLLRGKWKNNKTAEDFAQIEKLMSDNGLIHAGDASGLRRSELKKLSDIAREIASHRPITMDEFTRLKAGNPNQNVLTAKKPVPVTGWDKTANLINNLFRKPYELATSVGDYFGNPIRWDGTGSGSFLGRALGTTALVGGTVGIIGGYSTADFSDAGVKTRLAVGVTIGKLNDLSFTSDLERALGVESSATHWLSDQAFTNLVSGGGFYNERFNKYTKDILGVDIKPETFANGKKQGPEYWDAVYDLATQLQNTPAPRDTEKYAPELMIAYKAAFSYNIGMTETAGKDGADSKGVSSATTTDVAKIVNFAAHRYAESVAAKMAGDGPESTKFRNEFLGSFYKNVPGIDLTSPESLIRGYEEATKTASPNKRLAVAQYIVNRSKSVASIDDLMDATKYKGVIASLTEADIKKTQAAAAAGTAPASVYGLEGSPAPQQVRPQVPTDSSITYSLNGAQIKSKLDDSKAMFGLDDDAYNKLADAFKKATKASVREDQELTAANIATSAELGDFRRAALGIMGQKGVSPESARTIMEYIVAPAP